MFSAIEFVSTRYQNVSGPHEDNTSFNRVLLRTMKLVAGVTVPREKPNKSNTFIFLSPIPASHGLYFIQTHTSIPTASTYTTDMPQDSVNSSPQFTATEQTLHAPYLYKFTASRSWEFTLFVHFCRIFSLYLRWICLILYQSTQCELNLLMMV